MKIILPSTEILVFTPDLEQVIEQAGRTCYKSEDRITTDSSAKFIEKLIESKHESVLEHGSITVKLIVDRGVSHELVRHRLCSFSQESTRYCNYGQGKFREEITVIEPFFFLENDLLYNRWHQACIDAEDAYLSLLDGGATPQEARSVLPNSLKTEIVITANPREWRLIFKQRCAKEAHPQMREVMIPLQREFQNIWPSIFIDK